MRGCPIDTPESETQQEFLGELRYAARLTRLRQVLALGLGIVLGLPFLLAGTLPSGFGLSTMFSAAVALLVIGLSLLNVVELLGGSSGRGGSYGLVAETTGGVVSFLSGWGLLIAQAALVAALLRLVSGVAGTIFPLALPTDAIAVVFLVGLALLQAFQYGRGRGLARALLVASLAGVLAVLLLSLRHWSLVQARPAGAVEAAVLWREAARYIVIFLAVDAVLASRRQIRSRSVPLPRALGAVVVVAAAHVVLVLSVAAGLDLGAQDGGMVAGLTAASRLPGPFVAAVLIGAGLVSAAPLLLLGARQIHDLSRRGTLPGALRQPRRPFVLPPLLFLTFGALTLCLIFAGRLIPLVDLAALMTLLALVGVNVAALSSRRNEPERRRLIEVPFFPLVPALAIAIGVSLALNLPLNAMIAGGAFAAVGAAFYAVYGRKQQAAAQEGVVLFGSDQQAEKEEGVYRILVPLAPGERREFLLEIAAALAKQLGGDVVPLQVIPVADPMAMEQGRRRAKERNKLFRWTTRLVSEAGVPVYPVTRLARTVQEGIIDTVVEEQCDLVLMPWAVGEAEDDNARMGRITEPVITQSACDTAVVAYQGSGGKDEGGEAEEGWSRPSLGRVLVPTAGGPHAPLALGLAWALGREFDAEVVATYVAAEDASQIEIDAGESHIQRTLEAMEISAAEALHQEEDEDPVDFTGVRTQVVRAEGVMEGILEASREADLVLIGASEENLIDQMLFGNLPRQIAAAARMPVMMVRRHRGLPRMWIQRAWEAAYQALPTLGEGQKLDVYKQVRRGARPDADFFIMMAVATLIGTIGLMQDSAAVIIGSMLVAPLFTPILAISLGLAQGDIRMLRVALEAMVKGVFLGAVVATVAAWASPLNLVTSEILLRTQPNLFDLGVALAAGIAGAYAIAREQVAAALPGVAIAAALVPPIGVVGFGLAIGDLGMAGGASLLVMTNLIAIAMAGSITLLLLGFRPGRRAERGERLRRGLVVTLLLLVLIAIPLAAFFGRAVRQTRSEQAIRQVLTQYFAARPTVQFVDFDFNTGLDEIRVEVTVWAETDLPPETADQLAASLNDVFGRRVSLRILAVQIRELETETE